MADFEKHAQNMTERKKQCEDAGRSRKIAYQEEGLASTVLIRILELLSQRRRRLTSQPMGDERERERIAEGMRV